ncbi:DUF2514 family protein [Variovorax ginsengisoli]|uniref:DUF2514 family protein n=1 Tax=Variovorax ginsengisoli TaxID=363844 RepID=A0ABT8SB87_9BURK|nr:DUF2514 family protein [Variovorax ginsengisoli]MDN8617017.1 DUF2514 family protein [Variovorax ginsengisoli]MDO1536187.1 DUF2514 family protein [Variovorax ginsengisoli]
MTLLLSPKFWLAIAFAAVVAFAGVQTLRVAGGKADLSELRSEFADYRAAAAETARLAARAERAEEQRYQDNTRKVVDDARTETVAARAAAGRADIAAERLSGQLAAFRAAADRARADPAAAGRGQGEPAGDPIGVLAGLLERADARAGKVERYADALRIAGATCERYADGLQPAQGQAPP